MYLCTGGLTETCSAVALSCKVLCHSYRVSCGSEDGHPSKMKHSTVEVSTRQGNR